MNTGQFLYTKISNSHLRDNDARRELSPRIIIRKLLSLIVDILACIMVLINKVSHTSTSSQRVVGLFRIWVLKILGLLSLSHRRYFLTQTLLRENKEKKTKTFHDNMSHRISNSHCLSIRSPHTDRIKSVPNCLWHLVSEWDKTRLTVSQ